MSQNIYLDFVGLNTLVNEPVTSSGNTIGYELGEPTRHYLNFDVATPNTGHYLAALNIHRNGPYGWPIFKQTRISQNPLTRHLRKNSVFSYSAPLGRLREMKDGRGRLVGTFRDRFGEMRYITESVVSSNHKPLSTFIRLDDGRNAVHKQSYANQLEYFSTKVANQEHNTEYDSTNKYTLFNENYLNGGLARQDNKIDEFRKLRFSQVIYPRAGNSYLDQTRTRKNFIAGFWRDSRADRNVSRTTTSFGYPVMTQSMWPLDVGIGFSTGIKISNGVNSVNPTLPYDGTRKSSDDDESQASAHFNYGGAGELMAVYSQVKMPLASGTDLATGQRFTASCAYSMIHKSTILTASHNPYGIDYSSLDLGAPLPGTALNYEVRGHALWEAASMSGKSPFYDSYNEYAEFLRLFAKDHTIVPEFIMSDHIEDIVNFGNNVSNYSLPLFEMTGGAESFSHSDKAGFYDVYSTTDFLKNFEIIQSDHQNFANPFKIKLRCKAVKKFLPYDGFYPCQRTVAIAKKFFNDIKDEIEFKSQPAGGVAAVTCEGDFKTQPILAPLFAPGVLFNTIKAGVAVDFPLIGDYSDVYSGELKPFITLHTASALEGGGVNSDGAMTYFNHQFKERVPFEALLDPGSYFSNKYTTLETDIYNFWFKDAKSKWTGQTSVLYKKMINNFLSETADFFLESPKFTTMESLPQGDPNFGNAQAGKTYMMRLKMFRSVSGSKASLTASNGGLFVPPQDCGNIRETFTMYSRPSAFGIDSRTATSSSMASVTNAYGEISNRIIDFSNWGDYKFKGSDDFSYHTGTYGSTELSTQKRLSDFEAAGNHGYVGSDSTKGYNYPFTPPYYHGEAWADFTFQPRESRKYSLADILASSSVEFYRYYDTPLTSSTYSASAHPQQTPHYRLINEDACQIASSMNIRSRGITNQIDSLSVEDSYRWIIQSKYETPMVNFNHINFSDITMPYFATGSATIGMWHQYGRIPQTASRGVFVEVGDVPKEWFTGPMARDYTQYASLADLCGFKRDTQRLGHIKSGKVISEAVVAIPFIPTANGREFFPIARDVIDDALDVERQALVGNSIQQMVEKMKKFVLPPSLDFLNYPEINPFAMYIFEFEHTLNQQDLADIWQNLSPRIGTNHDTAEATIEHELLGEELLGIARSLNNDGTLRSTRTSGINNKIRWMVFKAKKRASSNYFEKIFQSNESIVEPDENATQGPQYNWPYDFFSLVELVKLEADIDIGDESNPVKAAEDGSVPQGNTANRRSNLKFK
jgi:hypothetical protein